MPPNPLTPEALAELERLERAATPGPWEASCHEGRAGGTGVFQFSVCRGERDGKKHECVATGLGRTESEAEWNGHLISALRNAFPSLLAEVRRLREVIGASYSVQRWTGANIAEVEKERDEARVRCARTQLERDAALATVAELRGGADCVGRLSSTEEAEGEEGMKERKYMQCEWHNECQRADQRIDGEPVDEPKQCDKPAKWRSCKPTIDTPTCDDHKCRCAKPLACSPAAEEGKR